MEGLDGINKPECLTFIEIAISELLNTYAVGAHLNYAIKSLKMKYIDCA